MSEDIKKVYRGDRIEVMFLKEMLEESEIGVFMKDHLTSSVLAGWADGPVDTVTLYVETFNEAKAKNLIAEYLNDRDKLNETGDNDEDQS